MHGEVGGVILVGPAGVGKTRLAQRSRGRSADRGRCRDRPDADHRDARPAVGPVRRVRARDRPERLDRAHGTRCTRSARSSQHAAGAARLLLLVDDAQWLDDFSAVVVRHLCTQGLALVVATRRAGEPEPEPMVATWKDGDILRVDVAPLPLSRSKRSSNSRSGRGRPGDEPHVRGRRRRFTAAAARAGERGPRTGPPRRPARTVGVVRRVEPRAAAPRRRHRTLVRPGCRRRANCSNCWHWANRSHCACARRWSSRADRQRGGGRTHPHRRRRRDPRGAPDASPVRRRRPAGAADAPLGGARPPAGRRARPAHPRRPMRCSSSD